ncbi:hypothetical protein REPUB_Repub07fG0236000 [Reevesia pubescens]
MTWNQRPTIRFSQATDHAYDSGMRCQCKENFQPSYFYVFLTFMLIVVTFSVFVLNGTDIDEKYGSRTPHLVLHLDSFSIIGFRVMENQLVANWTAKFIFMNKKNDLEIPIEPFDLLVFYKSTNLVSCASLAEPFVLKTMYQAVMEVEFSPQGCKGELSINDEVLQEIEEDLKKGKISLYLKLDLEARHKESIWGNCVELEPSCALDMEFNSTKLSVERFSGNLAKNCHIPLPA